MRKNMSEKLIRTFECMLRENERSAATIEKYLHDIRCFEEYADKRNVDKALVLSYKEQLAEKYALSSANSMLAALNSFLRFMEWEDCCVKQFTPIRDNETNSPISKATHFDFHALHDTILKIDVLGYVVADMFRLLEKYTGRSLNDVAWNDKTIYSHFENADNIGILEFDSDFMRDMLQMTKPKSFDDLVRITGLSHGTNTWIENGEELLRDGHFINELPALREDVFLQLLNYGVERENAFKIAEYVRRGRFYFDSDVTNEFVRILQKANVPEWYIQSLRKNRYMFPKAHAVAYVMNAVRMAWFKIHYPVEFYAAYLSCCFDSDEELTEEDALKFERVVEECSDRGIALLEVDSKKSDSKNYIAENGNIRMPYIK